MTADLSDLAELKTAEDFLDHLGIVYDRDTIGPLRVPTLRLFKSYLATATLPDAGEDRREALRACLARAYRDAAAGATPTAGAGDRPRPFVPLSAVSDGLPSRE